MSIFVPWFIEPWFNCKSIGWALLWRFALVRGVLSVQSLRRSIGLCIIISHHTAYERAVFTDQSTRLTTNFLLVRRGRARSDIHSFAILVSKSPAVTSLVIMQLWELSDNPFRKLSLLSDWWPIDTWKQLCKERRNHCLAIKRTCRCAGWCCKAIFLSLFFWDYTKSACADFLVGRFSTMASYFWYILRPGPRKYT